MAITVEIRKQLGDFCLDVAFTAENEVLALLGGSGSGKTMTLRCIAGIEKPDAGRIVVDGVPFFDSEKHINLPPQKRHVGLLFQNYALFPNMTVEKNIMAGLPHLRSREQRRARAAEMIRKFHLEGLEQHLPAQLSGGQQQRVALARILIGEPAILMLDEPFSALDTGLRWQMEQELHGWLKEFSGTTLFVSHSRDEVFRIGDRIAVYDHGKIETLKERKALFSAPETYNAARLTGCRNFSNAVVKEDHIFATDWKMELVIPNAGEGNCVGIRAHDLCLAESAGENVFPYEIVQIQEEPFSFVLQVRRADCAEAGVLEWVVSREQFPTIPHRGNLYLPPEALMLLRKPCDS
jgi:molybdate transport system ATP-binding protein